MFVVIAGRLGWHCRYSPFDAVWGSCPGLSRERHLENQPKYIKVSLFAEEAAGKEQTSNFTFFTVVPPSKLRTQNLVLLLPKAFVLWEHKF